ncbi:MAG: paraquat-inducible protein A [Alcanivoracaceae bacterium]|nr:paraquat-inducible protein A [Alcanivoracaceae bacterium]
MKTKILSLLYVVVLTTIAAVIAYESWGNAIGYSHTANKITEKLHMEDNLKNSGKKILEKITFSWYDGYTQGVNELQDLKQQNEKYDKNAYRFIKAFFGVVLLSLLLYVIGRKRALLAGMISVSIIALIAGWFSPILEITAYQDIPLLGNTIFQYESKSIITALYKIFDKQQYVIAAIILLFTIITPIIKTIILLSISFREKLHLSTKSITMLSSIGKWSMLDVFVVAIVVTYFSMKSAGQTDANLQIGVYFFSIYVILSMICTYIVSFKAIKQ